MSKFSIIIPVYNVASYLKRTIASVQSQMADFEVICVDDGSTDNSLEVLQEIAGQDPRVRVFHQENAGVSAARNKGLDESNGDWIGFLDGDDVYAEGLLQEINAHIGENTSIDAVGYGLVFVDSNDKIVERLGGDCAVESLKSIKGDDLLGHRGPYSRFVWSACDKFYKREAVERFALRFSVGMKRQEDCLFCQTFFARCRDVLLLPNLIGYRYLMRETSVMHQAPKFPPEDLFRRVRELIPIWRETKGVGIRTLLTREMVNFASLQKSHGPEYRARYIDWLSCEPNFCGWIMRFLLVHGTWKMRLFATAIYLAPVSVRRKILNRF